MDSIAASGIKKADSVRAELGLNMFQPINVFDTCLKFKIDVRFRSINMEGMYISSDDPEKSYIILSSLRPYSRRVFTCAHELGHHLYGHGSQIDLIYQDNNESDGYDHNERLVDIFASALLMPVAGIQLEFQKRKWDLKTATPIQFFTISSVFGVGYQTLISNCSLNKLISFQKSKELLRYLPSHFLRKITGNEDIGHLKIIDSKYVEKIVDSEVSGFLYLPKDIKLEGNHLEVVSETKNGRCYKAIKSGVLRAINPEDGQTYFIRIQNFEYEGLSEYRHLEN